MVVLEVVVVVVYSVCVHLYGDEAGVCGGWRVCVCLCVRVCVG